MCPAISAPSSSTSVTCCRRPPAAITPPTTHRVINPTGGSAASPCISLPLFLHPSGCGALRRHTAHSYLMERLRELGSSNPARPGQTTKPEHPLLRFLFLWHDWLVIRILLVNDAKTEFYIGYTPSDCARGRTLSAISGLAGRPFPWSSYEAVPMVILAPVTSLAAAGSRGRSRRHLGSSLCRRRQRWRQLCWSFCCSASPWGGGADGGPARQPRTRRGGWGLLRTDGGK